MQDTSTPNVAMYVVTKALSHHGLKAINKVKPETTKADLTPPIKYPAPTTNTNVAMAGILKYKALIGWSTSTINQVLNAFIYTKKVSNIQSTPLFQKSAVHIPLLCGTSNK